MHNLHRQAIKKFERETGKSYEDTLYPTPEAVPPNLRMLVAKIKMYKASARQLDIRNELTDFLDPNGVVNTPRNKEHLLAEMDSWKASEELWSEVINT